MSAKQPFGAGERAGRRGPEQRQPAHNSVQRPEEGLENRDFWLLAGTFFVCGFTTNGLVGTHMIALCGDHGLDAVAAGGLLAVMGAFDLVGTTASGWLTDRYDPRKLLFIYYGLRGLSLMYLPFADFSFRGLSLFAVFYGLDWIATVPPTLALTNKAFGSKQSARDLSVDSGQPSAGGRIGRLPGRLFAVGFRVPIWKPLSPQVLSPFARPSRP